MSQVAMSLGEISQVVTRVFMHNNCDEANTRELVATIVSAERDGSLSHGLFRVPGYVASLRSGKVNGKSNPAVTARTPVIVDVNGDNGFAPLALKRGLPKVVAMARTFGIAAMTLTNSYHFAALWPEVEFLAKHDLIGLACVAYKPLMAPAGGTIPLFGTNPIAFAWPRPGKDPVVIDMATSAMALGEVQLAAREGSMVPLGTGLDSKGQPTSDPAEIVKGTLLPFGGYKGSNIALMVELLAAGAVGDLFSFEAGEADNDDGGPARGGQFILAIAPSLLAGQGWERHCEAFFDRYQAIPGVRLPGSRRYRNRLSTDPRLVDGHLLQAIQELCDRQSEQESCHSGN